MYDCFTMLIDHENKTINFRQSWLGTAQRCPEEGRLDIVNPERSSCSDEAFIGTAAHFGIEQVILGHVDPADIGQAVIECYETDPEAQIIRFTKRASISECVQLSIRCAEAWVRDLMPNFPIEGSKPEVGFEVPVFEHRDWLISLQGTVDLVPAEGDFLVDWKTSGSDYKQKAKQKWSVQPTAYSVAAVMGGLGRTDFQWPMRFQYGVMIKRVNECRGQILEVERTRGHAEFMFARIRTWVDMFLDMGLDQSWPAIDEDNFLCSSTWCNFYSQCRGAHISQDDDLFGWTGAAAPKRRLAA